MTMLIIDGLAGTPASVDLGGAAEALRQAALAVAGLKISDTAVADEAIDDGYFVNVYWSAGARRMRLASAALGYRAHGFVRENVASGATKTFWSFGVNSAVAVSPDAPAADMCFLHPTIPGEWTLTPMDPLDPANAGKLLQPLGVPLPYSGIHFMPYEGKIL
jgi:hypothetical protein